MKKHRIALTLAVGVAIGGLGAGVAMRPYKAQAQSQSGRLVYVSIAPTNRAETPNAHYGIYATAKYTYAPSGKLTVTKCNDLIVEQDAGLTRGAVRLDSVLPFGEYECHVKADNARPMIRRFIVNNLHRSIIGVNFIVTAVPSDQRDQTEVVKLGPSLASLERRLATLEAKVK